MTQQRRTLFGPGFLAALPFGVLLLAAGCSKPQETAGGPPPGGPGGGPNVMVAANTSASQIYQQKCQGCHGDQGQGGRGPSLGRAASRSDAQLTQTIHDGHGRMPAFGTQLTGPQITAVVAFVKQLPAHK